MCLPLVAVGAALSIASTLYGTYATKKNASAQAKALKATQAIQEKQIYNKNSIQANDRYHAAMAERARLRAQSAESGLSGISINDTLNNVDFHAGLDLANMDQADADQINSSRSELQSRYNSIQQPDYIAAGLQIAKSAMGAYSSMSGAADAASGNPYSNSFMGPPANLAGEP